MVQRFLHNETMPLCIDCGYVLRFHGHCIEIPLSRKFRITLFCMNILMECYAPL